MSCLIQLIKYFMVGCVAAQVLMHLDKIVVHSMKLYSLVLETVILGFARDFLLLKNDPPLSDSAR